MDKVYGNIVEIREITMDGAWSVNNKPYCGYFITAHNIDTLYITEFYFFIDSIQDCCVEWGYFSSADNIQDFVGAELISVVLTSIPVKDYNLNTDNVQFYNFTTDRGVLQLGLYNKQTKHTHGILVTNDSYVLLEDNL